MDFVCTLLRISEGFTGFGAGAGAGAGTGAGATGCWGIADVCCGVPCTVLLMVGADIVLPNPPGLDALCA